MVLLFLLIVVIPLLDNDDGITVVNVWAVVVVFGTNDIIVPDGCKIGTDWIDDDDDNGSGICAKSAIESGCFRNPLQITFTFITSGVVGIIIVVFGDGLLASRDGPGSDGRWAGRWCSSCCAAIIALSFELDTSGIIAVGSIGADPTTAIVE